MKQQFNHGSIRMNTDTEQASWNERLTWRSSLFLPLPATRRGERTEERGIPKNVPPLPCPPPSDAGEEPSTGGKNGCDVEENQNEGEAQE